MIVNSSSNPAVSNEPGGEDETFRVELRPLASLDLLVLAGAVDLSVVHELADAALHALAGGREVAVDWSAAGRISAGALQVLLALGAALDARGTALSVTGDNPGIRHTLELAGLTDFFPLEKGTA